MTVQFLGYALPGTVVFLFGVAWSWGHAAPPCAARAAKHRAGWCQCCHLLGRHARHPVQGTLKMLVALVGVVGSLFAAYPDGSFQYVGDVQFATVYLFFALSGLLDVLACYCPQAVGRDLARLGLALAFFMEAFLFHHVEGVVDDPEVSGQQALHLLVAVMVVCGAATALGGLLPATKQSVDAVRSVACVVHGTWLYHCGMLLYWPSAAPASAPPAVILAFAWHCAAAVSLLVVFLMTRRTTRRSRCTAGREQGRCRTSPSSSSSPVAVAAHHVMPMPLAGLVRGHPGHHAQGQSPSPHHSCLLCDAAATVSYHSYHRASSLA